MEKIQRALVTFSEAQLGDLAIGDVAGRDITYNFFVLLVQCEKKKSQCCVINVTQHCDLPHIRLTSSWLFRDSQ